MNSSPAKNPTPPSCVRDPRRDAVRVAQGSNGIDFVESSSDQPVLHVYFLGKLPPQLREGGASVGQYLRVEGGQRVTDLRVVDTDAEVDPDPARDDCLHVSLDRYGDLSPYTLRIVGIPEIDPHYATGSFSFHVDCPTELDCRPTDGCSLAPLEEPRVNYLAKDFASFRQLILDRLALLVPGWKERHAADLGITLVELLAYVGDHLSYYQDAVATEAYLDTARQRISVRRHVRLVDYRLHEGCNARAWLTLSTSSDCALETAAIGFVTALNPSGPAARTVLSPAELSRLTDQDFEYFEPIHPSPSVELREAHNEIRFYTWGNRECCLPQGATSASLLDGFTASAGSEATRKLALAPGQVVIFEQVIGAKTGAAADADPRRRHAVRILTVELLEDPIYRVSTGEGEALRERATPVVRITWAVADALPFALCLSSLGAAPACAYLSDVSVARGNVLLVDHGRTVREPLPAVPVAAGVSCCSCEGVPSDVSYGPGRYRPALRYPALTFAERSALAGPASAALAQDPRRALPEVVLEDTEGVSWTSVLDLIDSHAHDSHFVVEVDNDGLAQLRFGDGELGRAPSPGASYLARYRVGTGRRGNVGAEAIQRLVLTQSTLDGVSITVRNPLPAQGGCDPEPIAEAKLLAPRAFRKLLQRAITAQDYAALAALNPALQGASAELVWNGSWYEAQVAIDPLRGPEPEGALVEAVTASLHRYRRIGHDLRVRPSERVPIKLTLEVCVRPGYERAHVREALRARFCGRPGASAGALFDVDTTALGQSIYVSQLVAIAQQVAGVECATVRELRRLFEPAGFELASGLLVLSARETAQLEDDPVHPEHGQLALIMRGGR